MMGTLETDQFDLNNSAFFGPTGTVGLSVKIDTQEVVTNFLKEKVGGYP